jgi:hypothetical protein
LIEKINSIFINFLYFHLMLRPSRSAKADAAAGLREAVHESLKNNKPAESRMYRHHAWP